VLDANPLEDIRYTRRINAVVVNGRYLNRQALDGLLAQARPAAVTKLLIRRDRDLAERVPANPKLASIPNASEGWGFVHHRDARSASSGELETTRADKRASGATR
jgi:hypothetical protein